MRKNQPAKNAVCVLAVFAAVLLGGCGTGKAVEYDDDLRAEGEELVFSFELEQPDEQGQPRKVSVCVSTENDYIVCRIGTKDNMELVFPERHANSWDKFSYTKYISPGNLDLDYLFFDIDDLHYAISNEYSVADDDSYVGIRVKKAGTDGEDNFRGVKDSRKGSLMAVDEYPVNSVPWYEADM